MIPLSEKLVIEDAFFSAETTYYKPSLYSFIDKNFSEDAPFGRKTLDVLHRLKSVIGNKAHDIILKDDLDAIEASLSLVPKQYDEQMWRNMLPEIRAQVKTVLGLDFKTRNIFFEEKFPPGLFIFEKKGASSITVFEGNKDSGIYFLNKRVSSLFTPILLIHEQLHSCLSQNKSKKQIYVEWFEEGLCQWYSILIYYNLTKNTEVIDLYRKRNFIYSRVKPEHNFTKRYYEYMKIFHRLYLAGGPILIGKILLDYLSDNREKVNKNLEKVYMPVKYLPKRKIESVLINFTSEIEPEKVTPLEYQILRNITSPIPIDELAAAVNAPDAVLKRILVRLNMKGMIVMKGDNVEINWRKKDLYDYGLIKPIFPL